MTAALQAARDALSQRRAWLVGGAVRDRLLARESSDLDLVVEGEVAGAARATARAAGGAACFPLSDEFGAWRVAARDGSWQLDLEPLREGSIEADLALRDLTINAIAEPLGGGEWIDPLGGAEDLAAGRLRMAGPAAFASDPLRILRLVRMAGELGFAVEPATLASAARSAPELPRVSGERIFMELRRIVAGAAPRSGLELLATLGASAFVLPELEQMRGVRQSRFHHLDVYEHTLCVLDGVIELESPDAAALEPLPASVRGAVADLLAEPLADGLTRGQALRWGALLHDAAKPLTRGWAAGRVTFLGHDERGAELAREVLTRLRTSERLRSHVAALVREHLRLGFLVHEPQPLARTALYAYLRACEPVGADVTLLSIADRLATRGSGSERAIEAHLQLARQVLADALPWHRDGPPAPLLRGDELAGALGIEPGPRLGRLIEALAQARYAGEVQTREQALELARALSATE